MYKQTNLEIQLRPNWIYLTLGKRFLGLYISNFLPVIEIKSVKWYFYRKLRVAFFFFGFEWIDYTKSYKWGKPKSKFYYWGWGEWAPMSKEEYNEWKAENE